MLKNDFFNIFPDIQFQKHKEASHKMSSHIEMMFGANVGTILSVVFDKLVEMDVKIDREMFDKCVNDAVFEVMLAQVEQMKGNVTASNVTAPKKQEEPKPKKAATKKPAEPVDTKALCKYVITRGSSKGNTCGKPCKAGSAGCSAHADKMKQELVHESDDDMFEKSDSEMPAAAVKCSAVITKGSRAGQQCGAVVKSGEKCATHSKSLSSKAAAKPAAPVVATTSEPKVVALLYNSDRGILFHPETGFVFKSKDERVVSGHVEVDRSKRTAVPVGEVRDLTPDEIEAIIKDSAKFGGFTFTIDPKYTTAMADEPAQETDDLFNF